MARPLYVDLDNSLILTDVLWEQIAQLLCHRTRFVPSFLRSCLGGRTSLKTWLCKTIEMPVELLPWNMEVVEMIKSYKASGSPVFLATASHESIANQIAEHLKFFDGVLATSEVCNLKGSAKLTAIRKHCAELGFDSFGYIGDCCADIPIWVESEEGWIVSGRGDSKKALRAVPRLKTIPRSSNLISAWIRMLRPQQWSKNVLLFLPLILAHRFEDKSLDSLAFLAFAAFSLTASAVYLFNDFSDVFKDRAHPRKRTRPLAAGEIPLWQAPFGSAVLLGIGALVGWVGIGPHFVALLGFYFLANVLYTFWLKHHPIVDAVVLALLYGLRIFAGGLATGVEVSKWLLTFSLFFFLSLAFGKRYQEIMPETLKEEPSLKIRGYLLGDLAVVGMSGLSSGFISVMVLALYLYSPEVQRLYATPVLLWLLCPLMIYWIGRFWLLTWRGWLHDDPVIFALRDRLSWIIGLLLLVDLAVAKLFS